MPKKSFISVGKLFLFSLILLFSFAFLSSSALARSTERTGIFIDYSIPTKTISINNLINNVAELKLEKNICSPMLNGVAKCSAEISGISNYDLNTLTENYYLMSFENIKQENALGKGLNSWNWNSWYEDTEIYKVDIDDWGKCFDITNSTEYDCIVGTHKEDRIRDIKVPFKLQKDILPKDKKFHIILTGEITEAVEWLPTFYGVKLTEWAWWNSSWSNKKALEITELAGKTYNGVSVLINVNYSANMQNNFDDLRFTYYNATADTETEIVYNITDYIASTTANIYINATYLKASDTTTYYMYYGNSEVSTTSLSTYGRDEFVQNAESTLIGNGDIDERSYGYRIYANLDSSLVSVTKTPLHNCLSVNLSDNSYNPIAQATFIEDIATFSTPQNLVSGTEYIISSGGGSCKRWSDTTPSFPYVNDYVTFEIGIEDGANQTFAWNYVSISVIAEISVSYVFGAEETQPLIIPTINPPSPSNESRTIGNSVTLNCTSKNVTENEINIEFYVDDVIKQNSTLTEYTFATTDGQTYTYKCRANDNYTNSDYSEIRTFTENTKPTQTSINILSDEATNSTIANLSANYTYADEEADLEANHYFKWFKDSVEQIALENQTKISSSETASGEIWTFKTGSYDGYEWNVESTSNNFLIENTAPSLMINLSKPIVSVVPPNCTIIPIDLDSDTPLGVNISWYINEIYLSSIFVNSSPNIPVSDTISSQSVGLNVSCVGFVTDYEDTSITKIDSDIVILAVLTLDNPLDNQEITESTTIKLEANSNFIVSSCNFYNRKPYESWQLLGTNSTVGTNFTLSYFVPYGLGVRDFRVLCGSTEDINYNIKLVSSSTSATLSAILIDFFGIVLITLVGLAFFIFIIWLYKKYRR